LSHLGGPEAIRGRKGGQVSLVSRWYQQFRHLIHEGAKFLVIGGFGFLVTEAVFNLMLAEHQPSFTANVVSTLVAAAVTFVGNRYWTFRHRERTSMVRETIIFFALNGVGVLIQQACIELAKHAAGSNDKLTLNIAFLVGVGLATLFRFWSYRRFVWLAQPASPESASGAGLDGREAREPAMVPSVLPDRNGQRQVGSDQAHTDQAGPGPRHARSG
jgi:putative flippase GtrA